MEKESAVATKISDDLSEQVKVKQQESDDASKYSNDIQEAVQSNSTDTSIAMLTKMINKLQSTPVDTGYISNINSSKTFIADKESKSETYKDEGQKKQEEVNLLKSKLTVSKKVQQLQKRKV